MNSANPRKLLICLLIAFTLISGCTPGNNDNNPNPEDNPTEINPTPVNLTLQGKVMLYYGLDIAGATVRVGNQTATTDGQGYFYFKNITLDRFYNLLTVEKAGMFKAYKIFSCKQGSTAYVQIAMYPNGTSLTINAATGGFATIPGGARVTLPANAVVYKSNGAPYTGTIRVRLLNHDPAMPDFDQESPTLHGIDASNKKVMLESYIVTAIELETMAGEALQIATGKTASIKYAISLSRASFENPPATIPMWYLDESTGIWREEGTATRNGDFYEGTVSHLSFWNCAVPKEQVFLQMTLKGPNGNPLPYTKVQLQIKNSLSSLHAYTDSSGYICGFVFKGEPLYMAVLNSCNELVHGEEVGPFNENTNVGSVQIPMASGKGLLITGNVVNCNNQPVSKGNVYLTYEGKRYNLPVKNNGSISASLPRCPTTGSALVTMTTVDETGKYVSTPYKFTINGSTLNAGNLQACAETMVSTFDLTIDGTVHKFSTANGDTVKYYIFEHPSIGFYRSIEIRKKDSNLGIFFQVGNHISQTTYGLDAIQVSPLFSTFTHLDYNLDDMKVQVPSFPELGYFIEPTFDIEVREITASGQSVFHRIKGSGRLKRVEP